MPSYPIAGISPFFHAFHLHEKLMYVIRYPVVFCFLLYLKVLPSPKMLSFMLNVVLRSQVQASQPLF
jgi:hypothetical protein